MRLPWQKNKAKSKPATVPPAPGQAQANAYSSSGPIQTRGHAEVVAWLSGHVSTEPLTGVIDKQTRAPKKLVRKISPSPRGSEAVIGWLTSPCEMTLDEIKAAVSRASSDTQRRDSMDLCLIDSPRVSLSSCVSVGSASRGYLDNLSEAASTAAWDDEDRDEVVPPSPCSPVADRYLALVLSDNITDASKTENQSPPDDEDDEDDGSSWATNAVRALDSDIFPLASATVRRPIAIDMPSVRVDESDNVLPLRVGQRMQAQSVDVPKSMVSSQPALQTRADGLQALDDGTPASSPTVRNAHLPTHEPSSREYSTDHAKDGVTIRITPPSLATPESTTSQSPFTDSQTQGQHLTVPKVDAKPDFYTPGVEYEDDIDEYYLTSGIYSDSSDVDSDSVRDSVGNFQFDDTITTDPDTDDEPYDINGLAAVPHLDIIRKHLSLPPSTPPDEVQMYLARNAEIVRASVCGVVCNPGLLLSAEKELAASPAAVKQNYAFIKALAALAWNTDMARGGILNVATESVATDDPEIHEYMRKRTRAHLAHDKDMSFSQMTRLLQFMSIEDVGAIADRDKLTAAGRVDEFIDLVAKGILANKDDMLAIPGVLKHTMGLKAPLSSREKMRRRQVLGHRPGPSPLRQSAAEGDKKDEKDTA